jgi:hypothetical protein
MFEVIRSTLLAQHNTIAQAIPELTVEVTRYIQRLNKEALTKLSSAPFPGPV